MFGVREVVVPYHWTRRLDPDREHTKHDRDGYEWYLLEEHPGARFPVPDEIEENQDDRQRHSGRLAETCEHEEPERQRQTTDAAGREVPQIGETGCEEEQRIEELLSTGDPGDTLHV